MSHDHSPSLRAFDFQVIKNRALQLADHYHLPEQDREDLEQELTCHLLHQLQSYSPHRGHWNAFVVTVVDRKSKNLMRDRRALKRDPRRACSLQKTVQFQEEGGVELGTTLDANRVRAHRDVYSPCEQDAVDLRVDLDAVLASLPEEARQLAEHLKFQSVTEVARDLGIPRSTLQSRVQKLLSPSQKERLREFL